MESSEMTSKSAARSMTPQRPENEGEHEPRTAVVGNDNRMVKGSGQGREVGCQVIRRYRRTERRTGARG